MADIENIKGSDGSGNAANSIVQNSRSPGSSTIVVNTVAGINDKFIGSMGTPHTFVDPVTSETITVTSEATTVDFYGHVDGANLEIDLIAPGYTDLGSEVGDIIIIKPTTSWANEIADILSVSLDDDGSLKDDIVTTPKIIDDAVTTPKILDDAITTAKILDDNVTAPKIIGLDKSNLTTDYNPYKFYATRTAAWTAGLDTKITLDTEIFDTNGDFNTTTGRYTAPVDGFYQINFGESSSTTAGVGYYGYITKNGTQIARGSTYIAGYTNGSQWNGSRGAILIQLTAGDYLELWHHGVASNTGGGSYTTYMSGHLVSRT